MQRYSHRRGFPRRTNGTLSRENINLRMVVMVFHWPLMYQHRTDCHENVIYVKQIEIYHRLSRVDWEKKTD